MSDDPRGKTLWEMFLDWMRGEGEPERVVSSMPPLESSLPPVPNPLGLVVGEARQLVPANGEAFAQPVVVRELRHVVRRIAGRAFSFTDYVVVPPGYEEVRIRCVPDSSGESRLLLECVDGFPMEDGFLEVVNDDTKVFDITDDDTGAKERFERVNGVMGPYRAMVRAGRRVSTVDYWDWVRTVPDGSEEFVFVEHVLETGNVEIWRGWRLLE